MKISKKNTTKSRLLDFLTVMNVKNSEFYRITGLGNGFLDKNNSINSDKIEIIISKFPEISLDWLITGRGEMLKTKTNCAKSSESAILSNAQMPYTDYKVSKKNDITQEKIEKNSTIELLLARLDSQSREIGRLEERINQLQTEKN